MKKAGIALIVFLLLVFGFLSFRWVKHRIDYAITDALFVRSSSMVNLAFEVSGRVVEVHADMGDRVKKGQLLARIDPQDYELQVMLLQGKLDSLLSQREGLQLQIQRLDKQLSLQVGISEDGLKEIRAKEGQILRQIEELRIQTEQVARDRERLENLLKEGLIPSQRFEQVDTQHRSLLIKEKALMEQLSEVRAIYARAQKDLQSSKTERNRLVELREQVRALDGEIESLKAQLQKAKLDLKRAELVAPADGVIAKKFVSAGDMVRAGQPVYSLIEDGSYYVEALLEETKLRGVRVGSKAYVWLDAYPGRVFEGVVEEISPASAATYALVPRDVSAGEFTKVVQRIPVKIRITNGDRSLLRVGMGGRVEIKRER